MPSTKAENYSDVQSVSFFGGGGETMSPPQRLGLKSQSSFPLSPGRKQRGVEINNVDF
jgi:hypothetical protein